MKGTVYTETLIHSAPEAFVSEAVSTDHRHARKRQTRDRSCVRRSNFHRRHRNFGRRTQRSSFLSKNLMKLASRMDRILIETAFEVLVKARALEAQGRSIIHLEIGEPDFETPPAIIEAGKKALDEGWTHYGPTAGYPDFREVLAKHVSETRGINVGIENVCVVPGGKPIIFFPILALIEEGDEVIYPNPGFPIYESMIQFSGGVPVPMPLLEDRSFSFDLDLLRSKITDKTKLLILNSPQNPTGGVIPAEDIAAIAEMVRDRDMMVLSDEIYSRISYGEKPVSIASCPGMLEKTIILDGFSKIYAMTGWRMGYGLCPHGWPMP